MELTSNPIIPLCMPILEEVKVLASDQSAMLTADWGEHIYQKMLRFEQLALEKQIPSAQTSQARYALAALIDEWVMTSQWSGRHVWVAQSLQIRLYGEHLAGVHFFDRLAQIRQGGEMNLAVLEVFYISLQLGFRGKYAVTQREELKALQVDIKQQIDLYRGVMSPSLSCETPRPTSSDSHDKDNIPVLWVIGIAALLVAMVYGVFGLRFHWLEKSHHPFIESAISHVNSL